MGKSILAGDADTITAMSIEAGRLFEAFASMPQMTLVLIDGPALAGGLGLACCADLVAVTPRARFALTEVQLGIPPAQIAPFVVRRLGLVKAKRLMLTAAALNGREALEVGLADHLAEGPDELAGYGRHIRQKVLSCAPGAVAATKALAFQADRTSPGEMTEIAARTFADCLLSEEGREGISSFIEKRRPSWASHD
jgi:isohexenylglutaconyl-CoA hydratase